MPSLLMQAARSAAIADGLVPGKKKDSSRDKSPKSLGQRQQIQAGTVAQGKTPNGDTVAAALVMIAAGNGCNTKPSAVETTSRLPSADTTATVAATSAGPSQASDSNPNTPSPALTVPSNNLPNTASLRQSSAIPQQKPTNSSFPPPRATSNSASSAGSAAHRLAVANSLPVAPKPNVSASSHIAQPAPPAPRSSSGSGGSGGKKKGPPLRRGKWTPEEEAYANRLIMEFKAGLLPLTDGTTLRTFLSKLLNCDPMRISKKFVGSNCIGKQVFRRRTADINRLTTEQIQQSRAELSE